MARRSIVRSGLVLLTLATAPPPTQASDFRIRMGPSLSAQAVRRALYGARERLRDGECRKLFTDFADGAGRPLQEGLDRFDFSPEQYLGYIGFYEGNGQDRCRRDAVLAFTQPGSLAVRVCPQVTRHDLETVEMIVIHELLHSLGLRENPPTSLQITEQVRRRCGAVNVRAARR